MTSAPAVRISAMERYHLAAVLRVDELVYARPWSLAMFRQELEKRDTRHYVVAEVDGVHAGHAGVLLMAGEGHVTTVAVDPAWQRRGIGARLLLALHEHAIDRGAHAMTLEVRVSNTAAIALYRLKDYNRAGLVTVPGARGVAAARIEIVMYSLVQLAASLLLYSLGVCGRGYLVVATAAGLAFAALAARGLVRGDARWARAVFLASIVYLPTVYTAMVIDGRL